MNYRNFENSYFLFNKGINTIIGENASGKTNLFRAIRLILDDNLLSYAYKLNENDFNRNLINWKGRWIIISLEFSEISNEEAIQALFVYGSGVIADDKVKKATYNLFFRPKPEIRKQLSELKEGDHDGLNSILDKITINDYETFFTGKSTVDFNDKNVQRELMGDFENVIFKDTTTQKINKVCKTADDTFKSFFVGQFLEAILLGCFCFIGMKILQLPYAAMSSVLVGVTALIPIVGGFLGAGISAFIICTENPMQALIFVVFLLILQQLEGNIVYPKVVGNSIGLPGIWVLAAVTVGGGLGGIVGMLISVPVTATIYKLLFEYLGKKEEAMGIKAIEEKPAEKESKKLFNFKKKQPEKKKEKAKSNKK